MIGLICVAQVALAICFGCGQVAIGYAAIGQFVLAYYALAQFGLAKYIWSTTGKDPKTIDFFYHLAEKFGIFTGKGE
jgi:hypothetical protein